MLHCLEHVTPCKWADFITKNAKNSEIRDQTLTLVESHEKSDHWLPRADDESRISICDQWAGEGRDNPFTLGPFPSKI